MNASLKMGPRSDEKCKKRNLEKIQILNQSNAWDASLWEKLLGYCQLNSRALVLWLILDVFLQSTKTKANGKTSSTESSGLSV